jgi:predicted nuclease with RNAse H fold
MTVGGLDLAAYDNRCSGFAVINDLGIVEELTCLYSDNVILDNIRRFSIEVLAIDAPIIEYPRFREVDREAIKKGFRVFPPTFGYMKVLTTRAWRLFKEITSMNVTVIETHPRSALKNSGFSEILDLCKVLGVSLEIHLFKINRKDLRDALISAIVALCYRRSTCIDAIKASDGIIYLISKLKNIR